MLIKAFRVVVELVIWLAVYLLPYFISDSNSINFGVLFDIHTDLLHRVSTLLLIGYSYFNYYKLVPALYLHRKYLLYVVIVLGCLAIVVWLPHFLHLTDNHLIGQNALRPPFSGDGPPNGPPPDGPPGHSPPGVTHTMISKVSYNVILFFICTFAAISIRQQRQLLEVQKEKLDVELSFLKAQINPHFLFNTLNSIYALAIQKSNDTPTAIVQLSELMRYLLKDAEADAVPLSKELAYINNYIALQKRRLGNTVQIDYIAPTESIQHRIAPLILMSFIENAFKHGVNPDQDSAIRIVINLQDAGLHLLVANKKVNSLKQDKSNKIGIQNTVFRLEHLYSNKHKLRIEEDDTTYTVNLTLEL